MTAITPGTGGTFKSDTAENALFEAAIYLQNLETTPANNPTNRNVVQVVVNTDAKTATITATLPLEYAIDAGGNVTLSAASYLT